MTLKVVSDYDIRNQWLDLWYDYVDTVPKMFFHTVKHLGDRPANIYWVGDKWETINYKQWAEISVEISNALISLGAKIGDNMVIIAPTSAAWGWSDIGIELAGGCTTTIFPTLSDQDVRFIINHSAVNYVFAGSPELVDKIQRIRGDLPTVKGIICFDNNFLGDEKDTWNLEQLCAMGKKYMEEHPNAWSERMACIGPNDAATNIYTSGTTGKLKAARLSHSEVTGGTWRSLRNQVMGNVAFGYSDVYLSVMPLAHVMERTYAYFCMITVGGAIAYGRGPAYVIPDMQALKPTVMVMVPRLMDRILKGIRQVFAASPEGEKLWNWAMDVGSRMIDARMSPGGTIDTTINPLDELSGELKEEYIKAKELVFDKVIAVLGGNMRCFASGGAALLSELHRPFLGMGLYVPNGYGLTETLCGVGVSRGNELRVSWNAPIAPGLEWKQAEDGELLLKGVGVIKAYYNDPEANAESFTEDGFFRTGDIVEFDSNEIFHVVDRKKAILVMDTGKNVAPAKVEALILRDISIDQVLVIGDGKKYIAALVCPNWDEINRLFDQKGITYDKSKLKYEMINGMNSCVEVGEDLANNQLVKEMIDKTISEANAELAGFEQVKRFMVLPRRFLQSQDELTPTSKTKARNILIHFAEEVEALYR
jgi:long-chain acyl-CoA synthetase